MQVAPRAAGAATLLFDDTPSVIAGAKAFGWDAIELVNEASLRESAR